MAIALTACASVRNAKDGETLKPNQGLLAFHVTSNADAALTYVDFAKESTFGSRFGEEMVGPKGQFNIKAGETYYVVPLDAGEYMFSKFMVYPRFAWLQATNRFKVQANKVTYIGHIRIGVKDSSYGIRAADRELEMRSYLADAYPTYFNSMGLEKSIAELRLR
jgi:hypothetical protein